MTKKVTKNISVDLYIDEKERFYNTRSVVINNIHYCPYCGKKLTTYEEWDKCERYVYRNCDCEDANKEHELELIINRLQTQFPQPKYAPVTKVVLSKI